MKKLLIFLTITMATLPFLTACDSEAKRERIAAERAEKKRIAKEREDKRKAEEARLRAEEQKRQEQIRQEELRKMPLIEMQLIRSSLDENGCPATQKLSEEERSRGWKLLESFGQKYLPRTTTLCNRTRNNYIEVLKKFRDAKEILAPEEREKSEIYQAAKNRMLDFATQYWYVRYTLTKLYSQFKVGVITADELAALDAMFNKE